MRELDKVVQDTYHCDWLLASASSSLSRLGGFATCWSKPASRALHVFGQGIAAQCDEACAPENVVSSKGASHLEAIHAGKPNVAEDHLGLAGASLGDACRIDSKSTSF
jgi:hypothetical protein